MIYYIKQLSIFTNLSFDLPISAFLICIVWIHIFFLVQSAFLVSCIVISSSSFKCPLGRQILFCNKEKDCWLFSYKTQHKDIYTYPSSKVNSTNKRKEGSALKKSNRMTIFFYRNSKRKNIEKISDTSYRGRC